MLIQILSYVCIALAIAIVVFSLVKFAKSVNPTPEDKKVEKEAKEEIISAEPVIEEQFFIGDMEEPIIIQSVSKPLNFSQKVVSLLDEKAQSYFSAVYNQLISYNKVSPKLTKNNLSFKLGKTLIAKITISGKTLRLNLALPVDQYSKTVYFQKDMSDVKAYQSVPFGVKIKSDKGLKNAIKLVDECMKKFSVEKNPDAKVVDVIANFDEIA